jgi:hypothetical protein
VREVNCYWRLWEGNDTLIQVKYRKGGWVGRCPADVIKLIFKRGGMVDGGFFLSVEDAVAVMTGLAVAMGKAIDDDQEMKPSGRWAEPVKE